jgi:hypothetical protein
MDQVALRETHLPMERGQEAFEASGNVNNYLPARDEPFSGDSTGHGVAHYKHATGLPHNLEALLSAAMWDVMRQGAILSWYMFDGVFNDVTQLFTPWQIERTYGICIQGETPQLALSRDKRSTSAWTMLLETAADRLYSTYPMLKTLYNDEEHLG